MKLDVPESTLERYRLEQVTEEEPGFLTVYSGRVASSGEPVSVRAFPIPGARRARRAFVRAAKNRVAGAHPGLVPAREALDRDGRLYLITDAGPAPSLTSLLEQPPLEPRTAVHLLAQVAEALDDVEWVTDGILSASQVVVAEGRGVLLDPPKAVSLQEVGWPWVHPYPHYAPPEVGWGEHLGGPTIAYSVGCILFECVSGSRPFEGDWLGLVEAHSAGPIPRLSERRPEVGGALDPVLARAMAKDPAERFASAGDLLSAAAAAVSVTEAGGQPMRASRPAPASPPGVLVEPLSPAERHPDAEAVAAEPSETAEPAPEHAPEEPPAGEAFALEPHPDAEPAPPEETAPSATHAPAVEPHPDAQPTHPSEPEPPHDPEPASAPRAERAAPEPPPVERHPDDERLLDVGARQEPQPDIQPPPEEPETAAPGQPSVVPAEPERDVLPSPEPEAEDAELASPEEPAPPATQPPEPQADAEPSPPSEPAPQPEPPRHPEPAPTLRAERAAPEPSPAERHPFNEGRPAAHQAPERDVEPSREPEAEPMEPEATPDLERRPTVDVAYLELFGPGKTYRDPQVELERAPPGTEAGSAAREEAELVAEPFADPEAKPRQPAEPDVEEEPEPLEEPEADEEPEPPQEPEAEEEPEPPREPERPAEPEAPAEPALAGWSPTWDEPTASPKASDGVDYDRLAAASPARRRTKTRRPARVVMLACVVAGGCAVAGYLIGRAGTPEVEGAKVASSGPLALELPSHWQRRPAGRALARIPLRSRLAAAPRGSGDVGIVVGRTQRTRKDFLPSGLTAPRDHAAEPVRLGRYDAYRHRGLGTEGSALQVTAYSIPTGAGAAVVACHAVPRAARRFMPGCERVASTVELRGLRAIPLNVLVTERRRLAATVAKLRRRRSAGRRSLAAALSPASQARQSRALQAIYADARRAIARLDPAAEPPGWQERVLTAVNRIERAYGRLAEAAARRSPSVYNSARRSVARSEAVLARLVSGAAASR